MVNPEKILKMREVQKFLGLSDNEFYCNDFSLEPLNERNYVKRKTLELFRGEPVAYHFIDCKTGEHKEYWFKSRGKKQNANNR
jgi:hypothetical protein